MLSSSWKLHDWHTKVLQQKFFVCLKTFSSVGLIQSQNRVLSIVLINLTETLVFNSAILEDCLDNLLSLGNDVEGHGHKTVGKVRHELGVVVVEGWKLHSDSISVDQVSPLIVVVLMLLHEFIVTLSKCVFHSDLDHHFSLGWFDTFQKALCFLSCPLNEGVSCL